MSGIINVDEAKAHFSPRLDSAHAGEKIVLCKAGKPRASLVPLEKPSRKLGFSSGRVDDRCIDPPPRVRLD